MVSIPLYTWPYLPARGMCVWSTQEWNWNWLRIPNSWYFRKCRAQRNINSHQLVRPRQQSLPAWSDYYELKDRSYIVNFDANNLYGWSMSQMLYSGSFWYLSGEEMTRFLRYANCRWRGVGSRTHMLFGLSKRIAQQYSSGTKTRDRHEGRVMPRLQDFPGWRLRTYESALRFWSWFLIWNDSWNTSLITKSQVVFDWGNEMEDDSLSSWILSVWTDDMLQRVEHPVAAGGEIRVQKYRFSN